ncbi:NmrA family NAD(P)-binding protein [Rhizobium redzepovicii]|uniref:NmrA family NAD(P)-binding protein n=1 Tax=Rhizobium redzepovicii TaxID=2867518 RepID=A0AAW8PDX5_9HYPH|nr:MULTISPECIES: NmrA family NAD(P)-binding protein [Rhizobium]MDF0663591.1 NmrA family NAD(P)-binding protein [Rhizobium sp. BC49]MDR9764385.1 NmrA family NAD(P)-binding protein [Rhizobium redzepovicii]PDS79870.1 NmrA family transcriptional regulator [Rhizobium sp. L18]
MTQWDQSRAAKRTIVLVGATSDVGVVASARLQQQGHTVRGIARSMGVALSDGDALTRAFTGADSAYLMIPFDVQAPDLHRFEREVGNWLAEAISTSGVSRVVLLSGLNAHLKMGTSLGAAEMEDRLEALGIDELVHLRAGFFNENFVKGMGFVEQSASGVFATPFRSDLPMPLIAARDIGERVADLLITEDWPQDRVVELHGGGHYTLTKTTEILARALGRKVACQTVPFAAARAGMIENGMSASFADALIETATSFNNGERWALEAPGPRNTTPTTLERWTESVFGASRQAA